MIFNRVVLLFVVFALHVQACIRKFRIDLTWEDRAPDGFRRKMILVNGTSPGPALVIDEGDKVEFAVHNHLPFTTSIHFHGITQLGTPWSDGVPGLTQKPIPSGGKFLYRWTADEYGTYFYHAHNRMEISDGLFGPILIKPKSSRPNPFHKIDNDLSAIAAMKHAEMNPNLVTINDWSHLTAEQTQDITEKSNFDLFCSDSILVNGKGRVKCLTEERQKKEMNPAAKEYLHGKKLHRNGCLPFLAVTPDVFQTNSSALPKKKVFGCDPTKGSEENFQVNPSARWASFHLISTSSIQSPMVSIDKHQMWVYAVDGRYIEPQRVDGLVIAPGERYAVMVPLDQTPGVYKMRLANSGLNQLISGFATVSYSNAGHKPATPKPSFSYAGLPLSPSSKTFNLTTAVGFPNIPPAKEADETHVLHVHHHGAPWRWTLSGKESLPTKYAYKHPLLWYPNSPKAKDPGLIIHTTNGSWVDIVFHIMTSAGTPAQPPHPIHKHSNKGYTIGTGVGEWKWKNVAEAMKEVPQLFNLETPLPRDMFITPPTAPDDTWLVMRYHSINPGPFLLHCHLQGHLFGGMGMVLMDGVDDFPQIPPEYGPHGCGTGFK